MVVVQKRYIRIAETTLFLAPECYENPKEWTNRNCSLCPVQQQCKEGVKEELIEVEEWQPNKKSTQKN